MRMYQEMKEISIFVYHNSPGVDGDQVRESEASLESHCSVRIIERLEEGCLELRQEWFQHGAGLGEERGQSVQHRGLHVVREPVITRIRRVMYRVSL